MPVETEDKQEIPGTLKITSVDHDHFRPTWYHDEKHVTCEE